MSAAENIIPRDQHAINRAHFFAVRKDFYSGIVSSEPLVMPANGGSTFCDICEQPVKKVWRTALFHICEPCRELHKPVGLSHQDKSPNPPISAKSGAVEYEMEAT